MPISTINGLPSSPIILDFVRPLTLPLVLETSPQYVRGHRAHSYGVLAPPCAPMHMAAPCMWLHRACAGAMHATARALRGLFTGYSLGRRLEQGSSGGRIGHFRQDGGELIVCQAGTDEREVVLHLVKSELDGGWGWWCGVRSTVEHGTRTRQPIKSTRSL